MLMLLVFSCHAWNDFWLAYLNRCSDWLFRINFQTAFWTLNAPTTRAEEFENIRVFRVLKPVWDFWKLSRTTFEMCNNIMLHINWHKNLQAIHWKIKSRKNIVQIWIEKYFFFEYFCFDPNFFWEFYKHFV